MSDSENGPEVATVSGRALVTGFIVLGAGVIATATGMRYAHRNEIASAQQQARPTLAADVQVECLEASGPRRLTRRGSCPPGVALRLTNHAPAPTTRTVLFALASDHSVVTGLLPPDQPVTITSDDPGEGPRTLAVVLAAQQLDPAALQETAAAIPADADLFRRLVRVESYVTRLRSGGSDEARAERFDFERRAAP